MKWLPGPDGMMIPLPDDENDDEENDCDGDFSCSELPDIPWWWVIGMLLIPFALLIWGIVQFFTLK